MSLSGTELPQELIEKIIDELDDPPSLLACCLVNHRFLPASQRHLRSTLHLRGESMSTTLGLFEQSQDDLAPLITSLYLSELASREDGTASDSSREDAAAFSVLTPRLSNVTCLVVDASLDAYVYGMRFTHIPNARVRALHTLMTSHSLHSLTFRNIQLHWEMEDSPYPTGALAALRSSKPVLETLVLHNPDNMRRPYMYYWGQGMFSQFIRGLIVSETGQSNWADASKLRRFEYYEGIWSELEHWDVKKLLDDAHDLKEFVWRHWRNANPFDLSHLPNVQVRHLERPKY
ncbi:hypothetical protein BDZ89DRAFT_1063797 [Hymenopellis radicata]|nr:hypothetical protein BDZ89DRAFT_1063797 [Hymenopellis radicata]